MRTTLPADGIAPTRSPHSGHQGPGGDLFLNPHTGPIEVPV